MRKQFYDRRGIPIMPGDLLRALHFIGAHRKRHYLYHVAVMRDGYLFGVPVCNLEPTKQWGGGTFLMNSAHAQACEIIDGTDEGGKDFSDRPRRKEANNDGKA